MKSITLICSAHNANGKCNVKELAKILQTIGPDVVFQEVRPSHGWSVEAQAVTEYLNYKPCRTVYVDEYKVPADAAEIKKHLDSGFEYVAEISEEYQRLKTKIDFRTHHEGFRYLNSPDFTKTNARMSEIEDEIIGGKAGDALRYFRQFMRSRESEMMRNIYAHCRENAFDTGVFLVGAAHKTGIIKKIESFDGNEPGLITWNFYNGQIAQGQAENDVSHGT
jgi:hypothetical protein